MFREYAIDNLVGKTIIAMGVEVDNDKEQDLVTFECDDGSKYRIIHEQDCCEEVRFVQEKLILIAVPFKVLEVFRSEESGENEFNTYTDTTIDIHTDKGVIQLVWHGESNGYYDESVQVEKFVNDDWTSFIWLD